MSINVYLKGDEIRGVEGYKATPQHDRGQTWNKHTLPGIDLLFEKGRWFITLYDLTDAIPAVLESIVDEISVFVSLPIYSPREMGIYEHKSATAEIDTDNLGGKTDKFRLKIITKTMEDARELIEQFRCGTIRPKLSYEASQGGKSYAELEAEVERIQRNANGAIEFLKADLHTLRCDLETGWPFCTKQAMINEISRILLRS